MRIRENSAITAVQRASLALAAPLLGDDGRPVIQRVLIANRGEIACRIIRTCRKMNITSIAIYVEEDADSLHVHEADEAISLGSIDRSTTGNPFLNIDLIIQTALRTQAQAVHPGYGYLSERGDFADAVRKHGLIFIGPSSKAMSTLGNKRASKAYLSELAPDVPLIPGFSGSSQQSKDLREAAVAMEFPVMLKASSGGGGKGMRIVRQESQLNAELERAQSEAMRSFGDADIILEKYIEAGKHVEFQIIGDRHGRVLCFHERDCSVQRRHQKIIEESPCSWLSPQMRERMGATAVRIAELIHYEGAGTIEFIVDVAAQTFYFLEVNARLQVEHPITEEVTGWDLVSLQLFAAAGGQFDDITELRVIRRSGHAIECRLCAEDANKDFFPQSGSIDLWYPAPPNTIGLDLRDVRYETAVRTGSRVSIHFDPMIAKIIVWAPTRELAVDRMVRVLAHSVCAGVRTNQLFLQSCLLHPTFRDPAYTTSFIPDNLSTLLQNPYNREDKLLNLLALVPAIYLRQQRHNISGLSAPFPNVQQGFRNQRFDPLSHQIDILEAVNEVSTVNVDRVSNALVAAWLSRSPHDDHTQDSAQRKVWVFNMPAPKGVSEKSKSVAQLITSYYTALSSHIRETTKVPPNMTYDVRFDSISAIDTSDMVPGKLLSKPSTVVVSLNGAKLVAHVVTPSDMNGANAVAQDHSDTGSPQTVLVHFPTLGTWTTYKIFSPLTFVESLRKDATSEGVAEGEGLRTITAPMPCKVLKILKNDGDDVEVGEGVMTIESMKMETSIVAMAKGKFRCSLKEGDAVNEETVLCKIV